MIVIHPAILFVLIMGPFCVGMTVGFVIGYANRHWRIQAMEQTIDELQAAYKRATT